MIIERKLIAKAALTDEDILQATAHANELSQIVREGNARQTALRQWFSFKAPEQSASR